YAADDVRYLFAIHDELTRRLAEQGRLEWLAEDADRLLATVEHDDGERWPHVSLRAAQFLEPAAQRRLLRLLRWRDLQARQSDRPRSWILENELASQLARFPPADLEALLRQFDKFPKAPRKLANAVWDALNTPLPDEEHAPLAQAATDGNKAVLKRLQDTVAQRSRELGLPDGLLASRRHLETLMEQRSWPAALGQWRRALLEAQLMPLLEGTAA
ncbi:HRDC domain-containing protein, partial [Xanthomonas citri]